MEKKKPRALQILTAAFNGIVALFLLFAPYATVLYETDSGISMLASNSNYTLIYPAMIRGSSVGVPFLITVVLFIVAAVSVMDQKFSRFSGYLSAAAGISWLVFYILTYNGVFTETVHPELEVQINAVYWISFVFVLTGITLAIITAAVMHPRARKENVYTPKKKKKIAE